MGKNDVIIHDADALADSKIQRLLSLKGGNAYGVYWAILESMRKNEGTFAFKDCDIIAHQLWSSADIVTDVANACVDVGLFARGENETLYSERLHEDILNIKRKREEFSKGGKKRWQKAEVEPSTSLAQAKLEPSMSVAKHARAFSSSSSSSYSSSISYSNSKEESKEKNVASTAPSFFKIPTLDEIQSYITELNSKVDAQSFFDFYQSKGWLVGKNKMKDWKACLRTWDRREVSDAKNPKRPAGYIGSFVPATKEELDGF